ncbi:MAG: metal ABC transporter ATP-binding protein [Patescibacteria group bacterium]
MPLLEVENLNVHLGTNHILRDVNFSISRGESLAIIGPNGAGKTILLKVLLELVPYSGKALWEKGIKVGYVPQKIEADRQIPLTVWNLLDAKAKTIGSERKEVRDVAKSVGIAEHTLRTELRHISGGQFQRVLIAFALLGKPDIILFDEPTASIDEQGEEQVYEVIHRLQDELNIAVIVVSHDLSFVYRHATSVLCLNKHGLCFGRPDQVLTPEKLTELYSAPFGYYHHIHENNHGH